MNPSFRPDSIRKENDWIRSKDREAIRDFVVPLIKDKSKTWPQTIRMLDKFIHEKGMPVDGASPDMFKWLFAIAYYNDRFSDLWDPQLGDSLRAIFQNISIKNDDNMIEKWKEIRKKESPDATDLITKKANELLEARIAEENSKPNRDLLLKAKKNVDNLVSEFTEHIVRKYPASSLLYLYDNGDLKYLWGLTDEMKFKDFHEGQEFTFSQSVAPNCDWDTWNR